VSGLVTLTDLQRAITAQANGKGDEAVSLESCRRADLIWLPLTANLAELEDQLTPNGLRQVPVFAVEDPVVEKLPHGAPARGLRLKDLQGLASRDGMARALARRLRA
jgi:hypothetical protein